MFVRSGTSWTQQAELTAEDGVAFDNFGWSVVLSADGSTALIGAYGNTDEAGMAYMFTREGVGWNQQAKLTAGDGTFDDLFGWSVALSADGSMALIGAYGSNTGTGAASCSPEVGRVGANKPN